MLTPSNEAEVIIMGIILLVLYAVAALADHYLTKTEEAAA